MTRLLYYEDVMLQQFEATIQHIGQDALGHYVILSQTAFYPTGGGQPHDTGWINDIPVLQVEKVHDEIRHYLAQSYEGNLQVQAKINWARRFDHMQQHLGQHILTASFVELFDYATCSFHLGTETVTIDLDAPSINAEQLAQAERHANEIIMQNIALTIKWVSSEEAMTYPLRKQVTVEENIRLVIIPNIDYNGCGGTHPTSTGQVSLLKIMATEKIKDMTRVHFICGQRILQELKWRKETMHTSAATLSAPEKEITSYIEKLLMANKQNIKTIQQLQEELLQVQGNALISDAPLICHHFNNMPMKDLQKLARQVISKTPNSVVLLASENQDKLQFVAARGANCTTSLRLLQPIFHQINGKGGGSDQLFQGGGEKVYTAEALLNHLQVLLK